MARFYYLYKGQYCSLEGKKIVLWSAGYNAKKLCSEKQLRDISIVVDRNVLLQGTCVELYGKKYEINTPDILKNQIDNIVILIGSELYRNDIIRDIRNTLGMNVLICDSADSIQRAYKDLTELFFDPLMIRKVFFSNISTELPFFISRLIKVFDVLGIFVAEYIPLVDGTRICFIAKSEDCQYVVHLPSYKFREDYSQSQKSFIYDSHLAFESVREIAFLVIYEDEYGIVIEKWCDGVEWDKNTVKSVMEEIKHLHKCPVKNQLERKLEKRIVSKEKNLQERGLNYPLVLSEVVHTYLFPQIDGQIKKVCHGDLHPGNIRILDGKIYFIDWEWVGLSDPFDDIAFFYVTIAGNYIELDDFLELYLERKPTQDEILHFKACILARKYKIYCIHLQNNNARNEKYEYELAKEILDLFK